MPAHEAHKLCADCVLREGCEHIPATGLLLRCLDRRTAAGQQDAGDYASLAPRAEARGAAVSA